MNLQQLVTKNFPASPEEPTILEVFRSPRRLSPDECLLAMKKYRKALDDIAREDVVAQTTEALLALRGLEEPFHTIYFLYALDYQEEGSESSLQFLQEGAEEWIVRMESSAREALIEAAVGSRESGIDFLGEVWGYDLPEILSRLTGKSPASARRWIEGGGARNLSTQQILSWARVVYILRQERGWSEAEIRSWSETPLPGGYTPTEMLRGLLIIPWPAQAVENYFIKLLPECAKASY